MTENEVQIEVIYNHQLIKMKFTLNKIWNWQQNCCWNNWLRAALLGDRWRPDKHDSGDRHAVPRHQGGAVVPANDEVSHEEIRPETHD